MDILALLAALALVLLNGFFVATEFAIVKLRPTRVEEMIRSSKTGAGAVARIVGNLDAYLSATQLGITLTSLALGWIGEPAFAHLIEPLLRQLGTSDPVWVHGIALTLAFASITMLHIVVGELAPKSLAIVRPESVALAVAYPMRLFYVVSFPAVWALNSLANGLLRIAGLGTVGEGSDQHSEEELKIILSRARSAGMVSESRGAMLRKALMLSAKTARHLMVPRNDVVFLDVNLSLAENLQRAREAGHTRFPLCDRELDVVIGCLDVRDVLYGARSSTTHSGAGPQVDLRQWVTPVAFFPELMPAERLWAEFRTRHLTMAVIVDEYGGAAGIVTVPDIMSAVMGEMDDDDADVVRLPSGAYDVDGVALLEELEERLGIPLQDPDVQTVAGFVMKRAGRMPRAGDHIKHGGYVFYVVEVNGPRVRKIRIQAEGAGTAETGRTKPLGGSKSPPPQGPQAPSSTAAPAASSTMSTAAPPAPRSAQTELEGTTASDATHTANAGETNNTANTANAGETNNTASTASAGGAATTAAGKPSQAAQATDERTNAGTDNDRNEA